MRRVAQLNGCRDSARPESALDVNTGVSLVQTGQWLRGLGQVAEGLAVAMPDMASFLEISKSGFGELLAMRHSAQLARTPAN